MKHIRSFALFSLFIFALILNWNCSDDTAPVTNSQDNGVIDPVITDDPNETVFISVAESCLVEPDDAAPYITLIGLSVINYGTYPPYGYQSDTFVTPLANRTIDKVEYTTLGFKVTRSALWKCETTNCAARWLITGDDYFFNPGSSCNPGLSCSPGTNCGQMTVEENFPGNSLLNSNQTYINIIGADCIVGADWQND